MTGSRLELADAEHYYGVVCAERIALDEQLGAFERARAILEALVEANPSVEHFRTGARIDLR